MPSVLEHLQSAVRTMSIEVHAIFEMIPGIQAELIKLRSLAEENTARVERLEGRIIRVEGRIERLERTDLKHVKSRLASIPPGEYADPESVGMRVRATDSGANLIVDQVEIGRWIQHFKDVEQQRVGAEKALAKEREDRAEIAKRVKFWGWLIGAVWIAATTAVALLRR